MLSSKPSHRVFAVFFFVFACFSVVFLSLLRSSAFEKPLFSDKSAVCLTANRRQNEGRTEAERRQKGGRTAPRPIHSHLASWGLCKHFCPSRLCCKGNVPTAHDDGWKWPIWRTAENCGILRGATMPFAKSGWQRQAFGRLAIVPEIRSSGECVSTYGAYFTFFEGF